MTYFTLVARVMLATGTVICVTLVSAMAQQIAGHRAVYDASLVRGDKARVIDIAGRMVFELRDACQGWDVTQRYVLKFFDNEGGARSVESQYQGWEDKAGGAYRFKVRNFGDSVGEKELKGFANVPRGGDGGNAVFSAPEATEFALPANTFFPVGHNRSLVARAARGDKFWSAHVFDGSELEGSSLITAAVGAGGRLEAPMAGLPPSYWPIQLAFFKADDPGALPQYEMSMRQHANGVASVITMDYGDFKFRMDLVGLEILPPPSC